MQAATKDVIELKQYLTFLLSGQEYALSILSVKEIIEYDTVTAVPKMPHWIRGVINLRGMVVPVIDIAVKFGMPERPVTKTTCIIIVEGQLKGETATMGIITDSVSQVMDLADEDIRETPPFGTHLRVDYLLGMAETGKSFALLLDVDKVLGADELVRLTESPPSSESRTAI
jgi:purine-binding chemotaxis protein CheW